MLTTFMATLVAILVAVPVAMFVATTLVKSQPASAQNSQSAQVGPAGAVVAAGNACVQPSASSANGEGSEGASANAQHASVWGGMGSGHLGYATPAGRVAGASFMSALYQNQTDSSTHNTTNYTQGSYNSSSNSNTTNQSVVATNSVVGSQSNSNDQTNSTTSSNSVDNTDNSDNSVNDSNNDNSDNSVEDSFNDESDNSVEDSNNTDTVNQTAEGLFAQNNN